MTSTLELSDKFLQWIRSNNEEDDDWKTFITSKIMLTQNSNVWSSQVSVVLCQ